MKVRGSRVLITGGAGFVGSHIADALVAQGAGEIIILDNFIRGRRENLAEAERSGRVEVLEGDIRDQGMVEDAMKGVDYVFHQAALRITQCAETPREAMEVMLMGTFNVLEAAVRNGVQKIVAASSASVYGEPSYLPIDELHPLNNRTLYGAAKIANEQLLRSFKEMWRLPYVALRYFNVYGPRMDIYGAYTEVLVRWLDNIDRGEPPVIFGDGQHSMDFVYVGDVAEANLAALKSKYSDDVFNVGTGKETRLGELCQLLLELTGRNDLQPLYQAERQVNPVRRRKASIVRAREGPGFIARTEIRDGLKALIKWREQVKSPV